MTDPEFRIWAFNTIAGHRDGAISETELRQIVAKADSLAEWVLAGKRGLLGDPFNPPKLGAVDREHDLGQQGENVVSIGRGSAAGPLDRGDCLEHIESKAFPRKIWVSCGHELAPVAVRGNATVGAGPGSVMDPGPDAA